VTAELYDTIGRTYGDTRHADPRVAAAILRALGDARTVLNVGAGAGNYEPVDREVMALEPAGCGAGGSGTRRGAAVRRRLV